MALDKTPASEIQLREWIASAIDNKKSLVQFDSEPQESPDFSVNLSLFGFKNPSDLEEFLLTPTGKVVETEIDIEEEQEERALEEQQRAAQAEEIQKNILKIHLLLWLTSEKAEAKEKLNEFIQEYNKNAIEAASGTDNSSENEATKELDKELNIFDAELNTFENQIKTIDMDNTKIEAQLINLEEEIVRFEDKETKYNASLDEFEKNASDYYQLNPEELDDLIKQMEGNVAKKTESIMSALDNDEDAKAYSIQAEQVALSLQLESLYDLRNILKEGKKIIKIDDEYYLLNRNVNINTLSESEKTLAAKAFTEKKPALSAVKTMVENSLKLEREFHSAQRTDLHAKKTHNHDEKRLINNQINLMQSFRAIISQPGAKPRPTPGGSTKAQVLAKTPPPASMLAYAKKYLPAMMKVPGVSSQILFDQIDKQIKNPKDIKDIKAYLKKMLIKLGISKIPSIAPLPQTTMQSLLKNMARFSANPYKPGVTTMESPMDTPQPKPKPSPKDAILSDSPTPTPLKKTPYK